VQKRYSIIEIYDFYEYQVTQYNPKTSEEGLSVNYINAFQKLKAEASGYPGWVKSPEDEEGYVESFKQSEGVKLDRECIRFNAAKPGLAKLCLNSMWGKLT